MRKFERRSLRVAVPQIRVWDPRGGSERCVFGAPLLASPRECSLVGLSAGETDNELTPRPPRGSPCTCLAVRGATLAAGFAHGAIRIFDLSLGEPILELAAHSRPVGGIAFHPTRNLLASVRDSAGWRAETFGKKKISVLPFLWKSCFSFSCPVVCFLASGWRGHIFAPMALSRR